MRQNNQIKGVTKSLYSGFDNLAGIHYSCAGIPAEKKIQPNHIFRIFQTWYFFNPMIFINTRKIHCSTSGRFCIPRPYPVYHNLNPVISSTVSVYETYPGNKLAKTI